VLGLFFCCVPLPVARVEGKPGWQPAARSGAGPLLAGAAKVALEVPPGGPIAGYPAPRRDAGGGQQLSVRALVLRAGAVTQVLVAAPLLLIPDELQTEVLHLLNPRHAAHRDASCLLLGATHTGPGGYWQSPLGEAGATGWFSTERKQAITRAVQQAVEQASAGLRPARLSVVQVEWNEGPAAPRGPHPIDPTLAALQATDLAGHPIGTVAIYGMHPTVIPRSHRALDGDWPEAAALALEQAGSGPALVLQGAGGDATWPRAGFGIEAAQDDAGRTRLLGEAVAKRVLLALTAPSAVSEAAPVERAPPAPEGSVEVAPTGPAAPGGERARGGTVELRCAERRAFLPAPEAGRALFWPLRTAATNLLRLSAPRYATLATLEVPGLTLQAVPAEVVGALGLSARARSPRPLALVSVANGYAGYVETSARWEKGEGEAERTWYGPLLARALGLEE
jgi:neutral ceramidase